MFDSISEYVITQTQLCGKRIGITAFGMRIIGFPINIESEKYMRNALMFNVGFVFDPSTDTRPFESVLRKLASVLHTLEVESEFLSRADSRDRLRDILPTVLEALNSRGEGVIPLTADTTLCLKLFPWLPPPPPVEDHQVPVRIRDLDALVAKDWDLTLQRISGFIDGVNYVKRIALLGDVDVDLVRSAVRQLVYYGCIAVIDIFQYSNIYATTPDITRLAESAELASACAQYITKAGHKTPPFPRVFQLYCSFQAGFRTCDVCALHDTHSMGIDDRRLVAFGVIHGLLRRIHKYPVPISGTAAAAAVAKALPVASGGSSSPSTESGAAESARSPAGNAVDSRGSVSASSVRERSERGRVIGVTSGAGVGVAAADGEIETLRSTGKVGASSSARHGHAHSRLGADSGFARLLPLLDGKHSMDQICCKLMRSHAEVDTMIRATGNFVMIHKA